MQRDQKAFTIVELLIVIVIIAVLAVITIITFNGMQQRAIKASIQSDTDSAKMKIMVHQVTTGSYPTAINCVSPSSTEVCIQTSEPNTITYSVNNAGNPPSFSVAVNNKDITYEATNSSAAEQLQGIVTAGLTSHLDPANSSSYAGTGNTWNDVSGNGRNATLANVAYSSENGGVLIFNGTTSSARVSSLSVQSIFMFVYIDATQATSRYLIDSRSGNPSGYIYNNGVGNWINFYADGQSVASNWTGIPKGRWVGFYTETAVPYTTTVNLMSRYSNSELLAGKLGAVMIYSRPLTAAEITQNFKAYRTRYGISN